MYLLSRKRFFKYLCFKEIVGVWKNVSDFRRILEALRRGAFEIANKAGHIRLLSMEIGRVFSSVNLRPAFPLPRWNASAYPRGRRGLNFDEESPGHFGYFSSCVVLSPARFCASLSCEFGSAMYTNHEHRLLCPDTSFYQALARECLMFCMHSFVYLLFLLKLCASSFRRVVVSCPKRPNIFVATVGATAVCAGPLVGGFSPRKGVILFRFVSFCFVLFCLFCAVLLYFDSFVVCCGVCCYSRGEISFSRWTPVSPWGSIRLEQPSLPGGEHMGKSWLFSIARHIKAFKTGGVRTSVEFPL